MEILFLLVYGVILGLVAPYISLKSDDYGVVVPGALALVWGGLLWTILTWAGLQSTDAYIWVIVMVSMPAAMWFGSKRLDHLRKN
jgi:hypothetical protein